MKKKREHLISNQLIHFAVSLLVFCGVLSMQYAFADSIEIASVTAHYAHPITGVVEDSGNDVAIGQGMTESVLDPQALVEVDSNGKIFGSFRLHMMDQIESYKVSIQKSGESGFQSVSPKEMKRGSNTVDFRIPMPSKNSIIRLEAYVKAMGRPVIFYGKLNDLVEGNTDFVVSVDPSKKEENTPQSNQAVEKEEQLENENSADNQDRKIPQDESVNNMENEADEKKSAEDEKKVSILVDENQGLLMKGDPLLEGDHESAHNTDGEGVQNRDSSYGPITMIAIGSLFVVLGILSGLVLFSGIGGMIYYFILRRTNDYREAKLYGFSKKN